MEREDLCGYSIIKANVQAQSWVTHIDSNFKIPRTDYYADPALSLPYFPTVLLLNNRGPIKLRCRLVFGPFHSSKLLQG